MATSKTYMEIQVTEPAKKTVYHRLDYSWFLAGTYLDILRGIGCISCDKEFIRLFNELRDYVDKKFLSQFKGEINDIYVIAEQIINTD